MITAQPQNACRNGEAHKVVAFNVTVSVVENKVKRIVGSEIVVSLIAKYKMVDTMWRTAKIILAKRPIQEEEPCLAATLPAVATAEDRADVEASATGARASLSVVSREFILCCRLHAAVREDYSMVGSEDIGLRRTSTRICLMRTRLYVAVLAVKVLLTRMELLKNSGL